MIKRSIYQKEILKVYKETDMNIVIEAGPGSGKTTILVELSKLTPIRLKSIFLAFNKSIAEELSSKLPPQTKAMTLHSLGMRTLLKYYESRLIVNEDKTYILTKKLDLDYTGLKSKKARNDYHRTLIHIVDLYRMNTLRTFEQLIDLGPQYDILVEERDVENVKLMMSVLNEYNHSLSQDSMIDFVDMLYLCRDIPRDCFPQYDVVMIDECQDLNPLQKSLVDRIIKRHTGRFIAVGDSRQTIYTFMGANLQSFNEFKTQPNTIVLPLSISYRCAKSIVEEANGIFPGLESKEDAPEGEVIQRGSYDDIQEGDFVLCRNNFPLVSMYIHLLSQKKRAIIYGKDYGQQLIKMLSDMEDFSIKDALTILEDKRRILINKLIEKGESIPELHPKVGKFDEMYAIIKLLFTEVGSVKSTVDMIKEMFDNVDFKKGRTENVVLMTCHKSKGLENDRIFFLQPDLIPSKYAQSTSMLYAEQCLYYVAVTRAKTSLIYLT